MVSRRVQPDSGAVFFEETFDCWAIQHGQMLVEDRFSHQDSPINPIIHQLWGTDSRHKLRSVEQSWRRAGCRECKEKESKKTVGL